MNRHRNVPSDNPEIINTSPPFSCFNFVDSRFDGLSSVRRCFSIARFLDMHTITIENIQAAGLIEDENNEILSYYQGHKCKSLFRIAFWKAVFAEKEEISSLTDEQLLGYAILKQDLIPNDKRASQWHIFEAVFQKYQDRHNCVPASRKFELKIHKKSFKIHGVLYCQQNQLNKACAHVTLRTLISKHLPDGDIAYRKINDLAGITPKSGIFPNEGLGVPEIQKILTSLNIVFFDIDYTKNETLRNSHPYQKFLYSGIESGAGSFLGFHFEGPEISAKCLISRHIIPFYGHTFNKDTWVPDAEMSYFNVGGSVGYIPSENWTSSFIGHDDNFGGDFCIPRLYVKENQADYVVELLNENVKYSGVKAEISALYFIYSLETSLKVISKKNEWLQRLAFYIKIKKIVLRPIFISKNEYVKSLKSSNDWENNCENKNILDVLPKLLPENMWMIEVSITQLFPANERKIGEVLLNPYIIPDADKEADFNIFLLARFTSVYFFHTGTFKENNQPDFIYLDSGIKSHMALAKLETG